MFRGESDGSSDEEGAATAQPVTKQVSFVCHRNFRVVAGGMSEGDAKVDVPEQVGGWSES